VHDEPPFWLPRGNVGTPRAQLRDALLKCLVPPGALTKLGLDGTLVDTRWLASHAVHGCEPCAYVDGEPKGGPHTALTLTLQGGTLAAGASRAERLNASREQAKRAGQGSALLEHEHNHGHGEGTLETSLSALYDSPLQEEWDRHLATTDEGEWERNDRPTFAYWNSENHHLFEEEVEATWEKGGSGLAFFTDDRFWESRVAAEDKLVDGWDTHDRDERALQAHELPPAAFPASGLPRERVPSADDVRGPPAKSSCKHAARQAGQVPQTCAGLNSSRGTRAAIQLDVNNVGFRLLRHMGWDPARPALGARRRTMIDGGDSIKVPPMLHGNAQLTSNGVVPVSELITSQAHRAGIGFASAGTSR